MPLLKAQVNQTGRALFRRSRYDAHLGRHLSCLGLTNSHRPPHEALPYESPAPTDRISHLERTGRTAYVLKPETLPNPAAGYKWVEDTSFNAAETVLVDATLKDVFKSAIANGYSIVGSEAPSKATYEPKASVYTIDIDGKPLVAFEATTHREAQELAREDWFVSDLRELTAEGVRLWDGKTPLRTRIATEEENSRYRDIAANTDQDGGDIVLAFLVALDGPPGQ
jgi:hypothetical protein